MQSSRLKLTCLVLIGTALLAPLLHRDSPQRTSQPVPIAQVVKAQPAHREPPRHPRLARAYPGHSRAWYRKLHKFLVIHENAKKRAAFAAWIEAISFPPPYLRSTIQCIKEHESGDYNESSHIYSGSGAYQYVPTTWRTWLARWQASLPESSQWKHAYYHFAYLAPPYVQDRVLVYTLQNGGAGNWHPRYGWNPCTLHLQ